jgi:3-oxoacyl-(acyl-carrier-protein) synthase
LARAINIALADAQTHPDEIDYISLDGLAIDIWDTGEINALKQVFGARIRAIPASCPKSMFGNMLGASGALDLITTVLAMEHGLVPPTINLDEPERGDLSFVTRHAQEHSIGKALVISRGRGGINAALIVEKG